MQSQAKDLSADKQQRDALDRETFRQWWDATRRYLFADRQSQL